MSKKIENNVTGVPDKYKVFNPHAVLTNSKFSEIIERTTIGHYQYQNGVFLYMVPGLNSVILKYPLEHMAARIKEVVSKKEKTIKMDYSNLYYIAIVSRYDIPLYVSPKFKTYLEALLFVYEKEK